MHGEYGSLEVTAPKEGWLLQVLLLHLGFSRCHRECITWPQFPFSIMEDRHLWYRWSEINAANKNKDWNIYIYILKSSTMESVFKRQLYLKKDSYIQHFIEFSLQVIMLTTIPT